MEFLEELKKHTIGFPSISKIDNYTGASHRIFVMTTSGIVCLLWFEETKKLVCKNNRLLAILKLTSLGKYL